MVYSSIRNIAVSTYQFEVRSDISEAELKGCQDLLERCLLVPSLHPDFIDDPCVVFTGCLDKDGYGIHRPKAQAHGSRRVHRYMYEVAVGKTITNSFSWKELHIDHACANRSCCNIRHLRPMSAKLNKELGDHRKLFHHIQKGC